MPLLDHFHPPLSQRRHWESFHSAWASTLADALNEEWLPDGYFAEEMVTVGGRVEIDVATWDEAAPAHATTNGAVALAAKTWTPIATMPATFPDSFAVRVYANEGGSKLVGAIELVSPGNKDRDGTRQAFAIKCANYLYQGIGLVVIDIVTSRSFNLHNAIVQLLGQAESYAMAADAQLYTVAYRPITRDHRPEIDLWPHPLQVGAELPTMPLWLNAVVAAPLDLDATYDDVCRRRT